MPDSISNSTGGGSLAITQDSTTSILELVAEHPWLVIGYVIFLSMLKRNCNRHHVYHGICNNPLLSRMFLHFAGWVAHEYMRMVGHQQRHSQSLRVVPQEESGFSLVLLLPRSVLLHVHSWFGSNEALVITDNTARALFRAFREHEKAWDYASVALIDAEQARFSCTLRDAEAALRKRWHYGDSWFRRKQYATRNI